MQNARTPIPYIRGWARTGYRLCSGSSAIVTGSPRCLLSSVVRSASRRTLSDVACQPRVPAFHSNRRGPLAGPEGTQRQRRPSREKSNVKSDACLPDRRRQPDLTIGRLLVQDVRAVLAELERHHAVLGIAERARMCRGLFCETASPAQASAKGGTYRKGCVKAGQRHGVAQGVQLLHQQVERPVRDGVVAAARGGKHLTYAARSGRDARATRAFRNTPVAGRGCGPPPAAVQCTRRLCRHRRAHSPCPCPACALPQCDQSHAGTRRA